MPAFISLNLFMLLLLSQAWGPHALLLIILLSWALVLAKLASVSSHVLLVLLMLEFLMLLFLITLIMAYGSYFSNANLVMFFFTLAVCEASLGLGLLISVSRKQGSQSLALI